jgi:dienelactone hydrolase
MREISLILAGLALAAPGFGKIVTRPVAYEHAGVKLEGYLAYDDALAAQGKLPGVLVLPEWWGLNDYVKGRAEQLAKLGYVALAADMFGGGVATADAKEAGRLAGPFYGKPLMAERARAGLDQLRREAEVDPERVAAIGYCFGGAAAQALAFSGAPLAGAVSFHGGFVAVPADAAAKTKAKLLICHGALDAVASAEARDTFLRALDDGKIDYQFVSYAGAVHAFSNPAADALARLNHLKGVGYNAAAARRSWEHMKVFFAELFPKQKK